MGKMKSGKQNAGQEAKQQMHGIKGGSIKKNKDPKFKNTSMGKVALINHLKAQDKNVSSQKNAQKGFVVAKNQNQNLPKQAFRNNAKQLKQNSPNGKQRSPSKAQNQKKIGLNLKNKLEDLDDSSSDDEGITSQEDVSLNKTDETFEDEDDSDTDTPDIFGKSLGDESDEDDEDFEEEQEAEEDEEEDDDDDSDEGETIEHKGVKMFKGLKSKAKKNDNDQENDDDDDDDSDESMEFGEIDEDNDDEDDDDDDDDDEEDEDEDDEDEDDDDNDRKQTKNIKERIGKIDTSLMETDEDDDDDDDDEDEDEDEDDEDEDEDEDENENAEMGLKALIGKNIVDDDDDEDFNDEDEDDEDDDFSSEDEDDEENYNATVTKAVTKEKILNKKNASKDTQIEKEKKKLNPEQEQLEKKIVLIDNLPSETTEEDLKDLFSKYGDITRIRLGPLLDMISKTESPERKAAARTRQMHPKPTTLIGNIVYTTEKSALAAVNATNGKVFEGNYLNVQTVARSKQKRDDKKSIFLANLKWGIGDNEIWKIFRKCGEIERVHLRRDAKTGQDIGFGCVNFHTEDAVASALKLNGVEILGRPIKVLPFWNYEERQTEKKNKKQGTKRTLSHKEDKPSKKFKNNSEAHNISFEYERNIKKNKKQQETQYSEEKSTAFQGQKVDLKNKKKNKFDKKKKKMAEKLTAKSVKV